MVAARGFSGWPSFAVYGRCASASSPKAADFMIASSSGPSAAIRSAVTMYPATNAFWSMRKTNDRTNETGAPALIRPSGSGKDRRLPYHHVVREHLRAYLLAAALELGADEPLFQTAPRHTLPSPAFA